ncbi:unnamed protein product [Rhizoctonia solani]|uniref:Uncharacterized protein n=1 Tax=Rhizoctonia solani TaxID=456999 RepID=A0A8H2W8B2_9AGAM|nr:unnamed protein product [Rhizoctonia solani]
MSQVADLTQQIWDQDQDFQDLQSIVEETNQVITGGGPKTPEKKPTGADVQQTAKPFSLFNAAVLYPTINTTGIPSFF